VAKRRKGEGNSRGKNKAARANGKGANLAFEAQLFLAADKLRKNLQPSAYRHVAQALNLCQVDLGCL
jgi:hypothetical protein